MANSATTRIFIIRHGERCDSFKNNFANNFDDKGNYNPRNINFPEHLPARKDGYMAYLADPSLTQIGIFSAGLVGKAYKKKGIKMDRVYASPSLRCIQTAEGFLNGYGSSYGIVIEPGLFEWMGFACYKDGHPSWMQPDECHEMGITIAPNENKICDEKDIVPESVEDYYNRSAMVMQKLFDRHPGENVFCFCHSTSHDACYRLLSGKGHRTLEQFVHILSYTEFLCNIEIVKKEDGTLECNGTPVAPLSVCPVKPYFQELLLMPDSELEEDMKKKDLTVVMNKV